MPGIEHPGQHPVNVFDNGHQYGNGTDSTLNIKTVVNNAGEVDGDTWGPQLVPYKYLKRAIIDIYEYMDFQNLTTTMGLDYGSGKVLKGYRYVPVIDDRNINDQGIDANGLIIESGNLWGTTRDVGKISSALPLLGEFGGRVNRIGFSRIDYEAAIEDYGFFYEYSQDSVDFDSDRDMYTHMTQLSLEAANKIVENLIQKDLAAKAGVVVYGGVANAIATMDNTSIIEYNTFIKLSKIARENKIPMTTKMVKGSRLVDTKVITEARYIMFPLEAEATFYALRDSFNERAFVGIEHYAAAGNVAKGEFGKVLNFRIKLIDDMQVEAEDNGTVADPAFYAGPLGQYTVFRALLVGNDSFKALTLHEDKKKKFKWRMISKKPGVQTADRHDPFGKSGFVSLQLWHGTMVQRPERLIKLLFTAKI